MITASGDTLGGAPAGSDRRGFSAYSLPAGAIRIYRLIPEPARRATFGRVIGGSTSGLALAAIASGMNGWAALWRYGRITRPSRLDGGFWGDWGT